MGGAVEAEERIDKMDGRLTMMMRSKPERKRSEWKLYAEYSCSLGMFNSVATADNWLMNLK